ncbi:MAG TPA: hypothetical protein VFT72_11225 [Opitutaceae bacterium]|nr:hypothetical protein [Opitutaceae bacterium]
MTTIKKLLSAFAVVAAASSLSAQNAPENPARVSSAGLLGYKYVEAGVGYININDTAVDQWSTGVSVNLPATRNIDVAYGYSYSWLKGHGSYHANDVYMSGIYYFDAGVVKPFAALDLGYQWIRNNDRLTWAATVGVEYQVASRVVLTGSASYNDDFKNGDNGSFSGEVSGHYWFTKQIAAFASLGWFEQGDFGYAVGATFKY